MAKSSIIFFLLLFYTATAQNRIDDILGKWMSVDKTVSVSVYREGKNFKARILWFDERLGNGKPMNTRVDSHNPDLNLRNRKLIGMEILKNLNFNHEKQRWENGKIYDASSGRTWDSYIEIQENGLMIVRGYWKWTWIGKTLHFNKM
ncbi:DUF2147 domain-containing protein [Chryseobacterium gotjawalense]|uniref:DUF2147 domain-containing protein n=2 Tax=Chryseobacterium TaxID=59732 RepID=A0A4P6ZHP0_9FLAO|nr:MULTISPECIES: DUF2147 domain-containing protein [Chryseobacterium]MDQ0477255.1 uncharacterized protein (DUF2147 family) [Chryseobacterium sp. MDT2-18]QBO59326.1 hypothetical protein NBC122_02522 [Chryseobacterium salivictor]WHF52487.1 DUF2147 domain-containing protein [Chryseobacterium sp. wdc7]